MLHSIKVTNFHSIGATQELKLNISTKDVLDNSAISYGTDKAINLVSCIVGHNASGKTNMLKALTFLIWFVNNSYDASSEEIPLDVHKLWLDKPTKFELEFRDGETAYLYSLELNDQNIISEYFGKKITRGFTRIFEYSRQGNEWNFKPTDLKINQNDLKRFKERKRVSILSSLIQLGYITTLSFFKDCSSNVSRRGLVGGHLFGNFLEFSSDLSNNQELLPKVLSFTKDVDLGIDSFGFREITLDFKSSSEDGSNKRQILEAIHKSLKGEFKLDLLEESNGTQQSIYLLCKLLPILSNGGLAIVDEIEAGLHPYVIKKIVNLFENSETNPKKAQLIFSTHQHFLLNDRTKTQIFLVEKDSESFESEVYRLDEVDGVRNDENYFQKYMAGVYGATPKIYFF